MALPIPSNNRPPGKQGKPPSDEKKEAAEGGLPALPKLPLPSAPLSRKTKRPAASPPAEPGLKEGWARDEETGIAYRKLPKSEYDSQGMPILQVEDFDADNLNAEASNFLGHLRVAPSKEEMLKLREERARRLKASDAE